ncbi:MAG TPA: autotransporter domain-containing protein [Candidatus Methylacidiphilales bacterium]|nr:autotransporter domain-containing protein [Candidatus Methylacidiphilales bacterium]
MVPTPGTFNMEGGTATFNSGIVVGATGTVSQTGGTFTITTGQTLDLSAVGASYTLGGTGILQVAHGSLAGTTGEGTLNFGGGTLQMTSAGTFTDGLDGTLTGTSTIDAVTTPGVTSVTMGGNYSGTGGITFAGGAGTTFQFAGTNTYTGPTGISSGTLNATQGNITNSSALNIGATGVLKLTLNAGGFAYAGAIGGTGALKVNFNTAGDPFVVLNTSSFTGPITLGANGTRGTLQVYSGTFGNIGDNGTGSGVEIGGAPLAAFPGGTVTPVTGVVTFGNNTYTGMTTVNSGFTLLASGLGGSVTNNGTLGLATGNAIGSTFNINGDLNQAGGGGSLVVRVNGNQFDNYAATTAELFGKIVVTGTASTAPVTETIVTTTTSLTTGTLNSGGAGGLEAVGSFLLNAVLVPDANPKLLDLTVTQNPIMGQTPNQNAVAVSLNQNPNNPIFAFIDNNPNLTAANAPAILEELTPESLQYARNISFENSTFLAQQVDGWCASLRSGYGGLDTTAINVVAPGFDSGLGRSLGSLLAYDDPAFHPSAPNGVNYYPGGGSSTGGGGSSPASSPASSPPTPTWDSSTQVISDSPNPYMATQNPSGPETPRMSEFIGGDVILADLNQNQSTANAPSSKANYTAADVAAGVSFRMTSHLAAGILFDYNHTDATTDSSGSKTTVDSYSPGLFATYFDHGFYANGIFSFGYNDYSNSRDISFLGENASSHPTGRQYVGDLDGGYDFHPAKGWIVGPTLGVTYTHLDVDSFTETGAPGADLDVNSQSADSLRSRLGAHVLFQTNTGDVLLQPSLTAMWQHEYLDNSSGITSSFNDFSSSPFTIETAAPSRDSALIGCGLTATLSDSLALYINYLADVGADDYFAQSVVGGFKARF